jgi:hypothetical protein
MLSKKFYGDKFAYREWRNDIVRQACSDASDSDTFLGVAGAFLSSEEYAKHSLVNGGGSEYIPIPLNGLRPTIPVLSELKVKTMPHFQFVFGFSNAKTSTSSAPSKMD